MTAVLGQIPDTFSLSYVQHVISRRDDGFSKFKPGNTNLSLSTLMPVVVSGSYYPQQHQHLAHNIARWTTKDTLQQTGNLAALTFTSRQSSAARRLSGSRHLSICAKKKDKGQDDESGLATKASNPKKQKLEDRIGIGNGNGNGNGTLKLAGKEDTIAGPGGAVGPSDSESDGPLFGLPKFSTPDFDGVVPDRHYPDDVEAHSKAPKHSHKKDYSYSKELQRLQLELVKLQEWIHEKGLKVVVVFEGRDAAGKGGLIKTITDPLNPRICSVVALGTPSDREKSQWYFQRYVARLPAAGEMVIFDRSWYNRAGVEKVMGFCSAEEHKEFLRSCPEFERMLVRSGIQLIKYWVSVSPQEQEKRFRERLERPEKRWKLSPMDLYSRARWSDYSYAKDVMFSCCDIKQAPWNVIPADNKKAARLNCISHLLSQFEYEDLIVPNNVEIPPLQNDKYVRPPVSDQTFVPQVY